MINKKYIAAVALLLCFAVQATAQSVVVERSGRAATSYYTPERGVILELNMGYTKGLGDADSYANSTPLPSYRISAGYSFDDRWKITLAYQKSFLQQDMGFRTFIMGYESVYGHAVRNMDFNDILLGGDYSFPVSRWVRPYVGLSIGMSSIEMHTDVSGTYRFEDSKWMFTVSPEAGIRGYFDKNLTVGYKASVSYNQYFGSLKIVDASVSSPSLLRIGAGVFVKFL